jgi:hypothetical protein
MAREKSDDVNRRRRMDEMTIAGISIVLLFICRFFPIKPRVLIVILY